MKKKLLFLIPLLAIGSSNLLLNKQNDEVKKVFGETPDYRVDDTDWEIIAGTTKAYIGSGDETFFEGLTSSGQHGCYKYKVHFDGLDITWRVENLPSKSTMSGFYFSPVKNQYYGKPSIAMWKGLYESQTRVHVGKDHDYNETSIAYNSPQCTNTGFGVANSMVMATSSSITHAGFRLRISEYNNEVYKFKFNAVYDDSYIWTNNANYASSDKSSTVYVKKSSLDCLDNNGDTYIQFFGFDTNAVQSGFVPFISFNDSTKEHYKETTVAPVEEKLQAYTNKMQNAKNIQDFEDALALRDVYLNSLGGLRDHDKYIYAHEKLDEADNSVSNVASSFAYEIMNNSFGVAQTTYESFSNEDNITDSSLATFKENIVDIKSKFAQFKNLLTESNRSTCEGKIEEFDNYQNYYESLLWVLSFERMMDAIDGTKESVVADVDAIYTYAKEDALRETINLLDSTSKNNINQRIESDKERLSGLYDTYKVKIIDKYLENWNSLLNLNLTVKQNILNAIAYYNYIEEHISITSSDAKYSTYTSYVSKLIAASDAYIELQINNISNVYRAHQEDTKLSDFEAVKEAYNDFNLSDFLFEQSSNYTRIMKSYGQLSELIKGNPLYFFEATGVESTQIGQNGVYFESVGAFPARINYNQALSFQEGIDIDVVFEEMAFYNDGTKANNISINFLNENLKYKGEVGLSLVIWVYERNSNLKLYNLVDGEIGACSISTPNPGESLNIKVTTFLDASNDLNYRIEVGDGKIEVKDSFLRQCGITLNDETYFSMGTFLDDKTYTNSFSIKRINDKDFSNKENLVKEDNPDR